VCETSTGSGTELFLQEEEISHFNDLSDDDGAPGYPREKITGPFDRFPLPLVRKARDSSSLNRDAMLLIMLASR
jgi:hypothetical protein